MAISKVKLPNNSVQDIHDSRISGVDTSPTSGSTNVVTSGGVKTALTNGSVTKVGTATVGSSTNPIYLNAGTPTAVSSIPEASLSWGGQNFSGSYGPIDAAMVPALGACRTMFAKAAGIVVEYSTDGGSTWTDYGATDAQKVGLFSIGQAFYTGKNTTNGGGSTNNMLRVTLRTAGNALYTTLNKFIIYVSTSGSTGCYCTIRCRTQQNYEDQIDTWVTRADHVPVNGWSGYNVINTSGITTYGNRKADQYGEIQFIFGYTGFSGNYTGLSVSNIMGFGGVGWSCPSDMARNGHLYAYDANQNAVFPALVQATAFKVTNGTASQFLKANGTVDSTAYISQIKTINNTSMVGTGNLTINDGKSAYEVWLDAGNTGTVQDYLASLQGPSGYSGAAGELQVINDLVTGGTTAALSAQMGKQLKQDLDGKFVFLTEEAFEELTSLDSNKIYCTYEDTES